MSKRAQRNAIGLLIAAVIASGGLAARAAPQVSGSSPTVPAYTMTPRRMAASGAAVVGLLGAVIGGLALARSVGRRRRHRTSGRDRRPGDGADRLDDRCGGGGHCQRWPRHRQRPGWGIVAMTVGLVGIALGGLALARSRRTA